MQPAEAIVWNLLSVSYANGSCLSPFNRNVFLRLRLRLRLLLLFLFSLCYEETSLSAPNHLQSLVAWALIRNNLFARVQYLLFKWGFEFLPPPALVSVSVCLFLFCFVAWVAWIILSVDDRVARLFITAVILRVNPTVGAVMTQTGLNYSVCELLFGWQLLKMWSVWCDGANKLYLVWICRPAAVSNLLWHQTWSQSNQALLQHFD